VYNKVHMEPQFKSSFIPKKDSVISAVGNVGVPYKGSSTGILDKLATVLFVLSLVVWGGLFGYQKYVEADIVTLEQDIASARSLIDEDKVDLFVALGKQVRISKELLNQHISLVPLFEFMEEHTIPSVQYTEFSFSLGERGDIEVVATGRAQDFADVTRQEEVLIEADMLTQLSVNTITVADTVTSGGVTFNTTFTIPRQGLLYTELVKDLIVPVASAEVAETETEAQEASDALDEELEQTLNELESF